MSDVACHFELLEQYFGEQGVVVTEGSVSLRQAQRLGEFAAKPAIRNIVEVGFNAGRSAIACLVQIRMPL